MVPNGAYHINWPGKLGQLDNQTIMIGPKMSIIHVHRFHYSTKKPLYILYIFYRTRHCGEFCVGSLGQSVHIWNITP